ncbi:MAG TPA: hypothetical protein DD400_00810, partial [Rhodospirillaceae bacterium]|nr:hypothetical protein [Rhodospirillaceae bacterium]
GVFAKVEMPCPDSSEDTCECEFPIAFIESTPSRPIEGSDEMQALPFIITELRTDIPSVKLLPKEKQKAQKPVKESKTSQTYKMPKKTKKSSGAEQSTFFQKVKKVGSLDFS